MFSFFNLLSKNLKFNFSILVFLYFLVYAFELLSISLIFPIIKILSDNTYPEILFNFLSFIKLEQIVYKKNFFLIILGFFLLLFILRTLFLYLKEKYEQNFYSDFQLHLKKKLLNVLYYTFDPLGKKNKSTEMITLIIDDVDNYNGHNKSMMIIITDVFIISIFASFLIILDYRIFFLSFIILSILSVIYIKLTSKTFYSISNKRRIYYKKKLGDLSIIFFGFIELKLAKKIKNFFKTYLEGEKEYLKINIQKTLLSIVPKISFEIFLVISISVILSVTFLLDVNNQIALVATFTVISFRLFPKASTIVTNIQNLKSFNKSKKKIEEILKNNNFKKDQSSVKIKNWTNISFKNIFYKYKNRKILDYTFLKLEINKSHLITGDNGSGKSTLVKLIVGLLKNKNLRIRLNNQRIISSIQDLDMRISYVPQKPYLFDASIYENVTFNKIYNSKDAQFKKISKITGIDEIIKKNNLNYLSKIGEEGKLLSGGEGKKISLARALYLKPSLLVLDEVLDSLDVNSQSRLIKYLTKEIKNLTIIMISHNQKIRKKFNIVYKLKKGKLLSLKS